MMRCIAWPRTMKSCLHCSYHTPSCNEIREAVNKPQTTNRDTSCATEPVISAESAEVQNTDTWLSIGSYWEPRVNPTHDDRHLTAPPSTRHRFSSCTRYLYRFSTISIVPITSAEVLPSTSAIHRESNHQLIHHGIHPRRRHEAIRPSRPIRYSSSQRFQRPCWTSTPVRSIRSGHTA